MTSDLDTLLTALYVKVDDELETSRWMGRPPRLTDAELVTLAVAQALLGFHSETRWMRYANAHLTSMFPYLPQQSGYNKRLKAALPLVKKAIRMLAADTDFWFDTHWIADSTPMPCGMSRPTVKRSDLAGWAGYGYCASHSRLFWGLRLYLVCTPHRHADPVGPGPPETGRARGTAGHARPRRRLGGRPPRAPAHRG